MLSAFRKTKVKEPSVEELFVDAIWDNTDVKYLISQIRQNVCLLDDAYSKLVLPLIVSFRDIVFELPASEKHHHNYTSGLFIHSLEVCNNCARSAGGLEFLGTESPEYRKANSEKWLVACAVAGLLHDLGKVSSDQMVKTPECIEWNPFTENLRQFIVDNPTAQSFFRKNRRHKNHEYFSLVLASQIINRELMAYLASGDHRILPTMMMAISGIQYPEVPLFYDSVSKGDKDSVVASFGSGVIQEPAIDTAVQVESNVIVDTPKTNSSSLKELTKAAINKLILDGLFKVNVKSKDRGMFWFDQEKRLWATWPSLFNAIENQFSEQGFKGYPKQAGVFLCSMCSDLICEAKDEERSWSAKISSDKSAFKLTLVRILDKDLVKASSIMKKDEFNVMPIAYDLEQEIRRGLSDVAGEIQMNPVASVAKTNSEKDESATQQLQISGKKLSEKFTDYCNSKGDTGDTIFEIAMKLMVGKNYYVLNEGLIILEWPKFSQAMGDDPEDIIALLNKDLMLAKSSKELKIRNTGLAEFIENGRSMRVLILSKSLSSRLLGEISILEDEKNDAEGDLRVNTTPGSTVSKNEIITHKTNKSIEPIGGATVMKNGVNTITSNEGDVLAAFDEYLSKNFTKYEEKITVNKEKKIIQISCMTSIFRDVIDLGLMAESDRQIIYGMSEKAIIKAGTSSFSSIHLKKFYEVNITHV